MKTDSKKSNVGITKIVEGEIVKMEKVRKTVEFDYDDFGDIKSFIINHQEVIKKNYNDVLYGALERYLRRPFRDEVDKSRLKSIYHESLNETSYYIDEKLIGRIRSGLSEHNESDEKIVFYIEFIFLIQVPNSEV